MVNICQRRHFSTHQSISIGDVCLDVLFDGLIRKGCKHHKHRIMFANGLPQVVRAFAELKKVSVLLSLSWCSFTKSTMGLKFLGLSASSDKLYLVRWYKQSRMRRQGNNHSHLESQSTVLKKTGGHYYMFVFFFSISIFLSFTSNIKGVLNKPDSPVVCCGFHCYCRYFCEARKLPISAYLFLKAIS